VGERVVVPLQKRPFYAPAGRAAPQPGRDRYKSPRCADIPVIAPSIYSGRIVVREVEMRKLSLLRASLLALGLTFALPGLAQAPAALSVSATVASTCVLLGGTLAFGSYTGAAATGSGTITATCTNGSTAYVLLGQGTNADTGAGSSDASPVRRMANGTGAFLSYGLYITSPGQTLWGNTQATGKIVSGSGLPELLTVYGQIPGGQYSAPAGLYTDTVLVTFTF